MRLATLLSFVLLLIAPAVRAAVLAIDYGAEFTKLSLVKPGVPLDVVLDRDSKRKIQSVVGWKKGERVFGQEGKNAATRFPDTHYPYVKPLLGAQSLASFELYPNQPVIGEDGSVIFHHPTEHSLPGSSAEGDKWSPTALLAHQLAYYRGLAEELTGESGTLEKITQVIVTVPGWWNTYQRKAYRDALELQGLSCLAMIGEGTGVALNYAMTRQFPNFDPVTGTGEKEFDIIYDSGAVATTATVVALYETSKYLTPKSKKPINTTHVDVIGTGHTDVGGVTLDLAVRNLLARDFVEKTGQREILDDKRAMAKLSKEAIRVKHILSANQVCSVNIESLFNDIDFRSRLTRAELEESISGASEHFEAPITQALKSAGLTINDINSVILFGGNTRVPYVQSAVKSALGDANADKIANNVNTDEAAVLGAAFYGAGLSKQFKMKKIEVTERSNDDIRLHSDVIFPCGSPLGQKKSILLPTSQELPIKFYEGENPVLAVDLPNLESAMTNFTSILPVVNLTVRLDSRGHIAVANANLVSNVTDLHETGSGSVAGAIKGLFGKKDKEEGGAADEAEESGTKEEKKSKKPEKISLRFKEQHLGVKATTAEEKRKILGRLTTISASEAAKAAREEARNVLEGYLYKLKNLLDEDTDVKVLFDFATDKEREAIANAVSTTFEWLHQNEDIAPEEALRSRRMAIELLEAPILTRYLEKKARPKAIDDFQKAMFAAKLFHDEAVANVTAALKAAETATPEAPVAPPKYTEAELQSVADLLKELEVWVDELMKKQVPLEEKLSSDPVIMSRDLEEKGKNLQMTVLRLANRREPKAPRPIKPLASSSTSSAAAEETTTSTTTQSASSASNTASSADPEATDRTSDELKHDEL